MSFITGFLNLDSAPADAQLAERMLAHARSLGPDGSGLYTQGPVALGHALVSITPESRQETSPWRSADGQRVITYDGRLDHREDLCRALGLPASALELPDPELILRAHEQWGHDCVTRLEGEFAFALWDNRQQELFCARDPLGACGFHYHLDGRRFVFASQIRDVLLGAGLPKRLDELTLGYHLTALVPLATGTLYAGVMRLPAGRTLVVRPGGTPAFRTYRQFTMQPEIRLRSPQEYSEALRGLLDDAVRSCLRTHHPVAAMLSGGLDSTGVACLAARQLAARGQRLVTVSSVVRPGFPDVDWAREESAFIASATARYPAMDPHFAYGEAFPAVELDDRVYDRRDEPLGDIKSFRTREMIELNGLPNTENPGCFFLPGAADWAN
ncbi:MAG: hypothetical protein RL514_1526 [Verrucomicrobiota bacterium]